MLKSLRSKPVLAVSAVVVATVAIMGLRLRKPAAPAAPTLEQNSTSVPHSSTDDPTAASTPPAEQPSSIASAPTVASPAPAADVPARTASAQTTPTAPERPAAKGVAAAVQSQATAPEPEPPKVIASAPNDPPAFEDKRAFDKIETPGRTGPAQELTAATSVRPKTAVAPPFTDVRPPVQPQPSTSAAPVVEQSTAQVVVNRSARETAPAPVTPTASPRTAAIPSFADQRDLEPSSAVPRTVQRRETPPLQPAASAPLFVDVRDPVLAPEPPKVVASAARPTEPQPSTSVRPGQSPPANARSGCEPAQITSEPLDGGRMLVRVGTPCRADQIIKFGYGDANVVRKLDSAGRLELTLDLFAGTSSPIAIVFEDGSSRELPARASDLDKLEKIALIWRAPVDLDLHAFEYGASFGQPGHVWSHSPSSALAAREQVAATRRGRGFLSRADSGEGTGDKIEVYTFIRHPDQPAGVVSIAIDYASRGDAAKGAACGAGPVAEVKFETVVSSGGRVAREAGIITPVACGAALSADARYGVTHQIRINR